MQGDAHPERDSAAHHDAEGHKTVDSTLVTCLVITLGMSLAIVLAAMHLGEATKSEFTLQTSVCLARSCLLVYRSQDGLVGLHITSGGRKPDRRRYFIWDKPDSAPEYATEAEARAVLAALHLGGERYA